MYYIWNNEIHRTTGQYLGTTYATVNEARKALKELNS